MDQACAVVDDVVVLATGPRLYRAGHAIFHGSSQRSLLVFRRCPGLVLIPLDMKRNKKAAFFEIVRALVLKVVP